MFAYVKKVEYIPILITCFWVGVISLVLFIPTFLSLVREDKSITLFTWPSFIDSKAIAEFEKETGIKVYISYYESNAELYSKLQVTKGKGYDLIIPTDHTVQLLIKDGLLKKIDTAKLTFFDRFDPKLLQLYFDPKSQYSLPFSWAIYGLGIDKDYFGDTPLQPSWKAIFDADTTPGRIGMTDDPREVILLAAYYLFGSIDDINRKEKLASIQELLLKQKKWVDVYTDQRTEDLLTMKSSPVVAALSPDIIRAMPYDEDLDFLIPQEGSFLVVDSFVLPVGSTKDELVYQLLNFLYQPKILQRHFDKFGFFPPLKDVINEEELDPRVQRIFSYYKHNFNKLDFFRNVLPEDRINDLWIKLMSY